MTFRIRKSFLFPLGLLVVEIIALLISCIQLGQPVAKIVILAVLILPVIVLFIECLFRRTTITSDTICTRKFLRSKIIKLAEVTAAETIQVKKRVFVTLCAGDDFLIFSNAYSRFPAMVKQLLSHLPATAISEETATMAAQPPLKTTDIFSCWLAVAFMGFILYAQLRMQI